MLEELIRKDLALTKYFNQIKSQNPKAAQK
jgi:hypothetical protein